MTEPTGFSPVRSDAIRVELVDVVDERPVRGGRRIGAGVGLVLAGMLVGGSAATATAAAVWDRSPSSAPSYGIAIDYQGSLAADGSFPGQPAVVLLGGPISFVVEGNDRAVDLAPPTRATHVRVSVTCTSPGITAWGFDSAGNNPSLGCSAADVSSIPPPNAWIDFDLAHGSVLYLQPEGESTSIVSLQYLSVVETTWGVNANGETYGVTKPGVGDPDLIGVLGIDDDGARIEGYVRTSDLMVQCPGALLPSTPEQATEQQERCQRAYPDGFDLPVYESDGVTRVGTFHVNS
jgi:hypothetical protein